ncbi:MAG: CCA tRNA nucleotidyltransferase [Paracoccaceae bacterium]
MKVSGEWLTAPPPQRALALLGDAGHQALAVGGCVRNALLGMPVADVDIATDARPERVMQLAADAGLKAVPTGIDHGTVTLVVSGTGFEITTFRSDVATDGRRATVRFSDDVAEDARRRDFTINALYVTAGGTLVDPLDGLTDLRARRLRFIGSPVNRIREDYLRILRLFRFHAWYGDLENGLDADALAACEAEREGIARLSAERITTEIRKLLSAPDPVPSLEAMERIGVLTLVLPGAGTSAIGRLVVLEQNAGIPPAWQRRLICLGGDALSRMRFSKVEMRRLKAIGEALQTPAEVAETAYLHGREAALDAALTAAALIGASSVPTTLADDAARGAAAVFPVTAKDLLGRMPPGPELGAELERLRDRWIRSGFRLGREELLEDR